MGACASGGRLEGVGGIELGHPVGAWAVEKPSGEMCTIIERGRLSGVSCGNAERCHRAMRL